MHASPVPQAKSEVSQLTQHANNLARTLDGLERASIQFHNMLRGLRGDQPTAAPDPSSVDSPADPPTMSRLHGLADRLQELTNLINTQADELNEYL